ncbi:protein shortage in chiasmata 1 ortholog [Eucyclogobius newberryi]|uniref:protein shortage in chiasmata 1 ortholog n=1 Tax=Eucyclogobius newberryi TaxID=166745 RepID=UPI003B5CD389
MDNMDQGVNNAGPSFKVTMNLLSLPTPHVSGGSALYPHSGHMPKGTYRTPWNSANVTSTFELFLNESVQDNLIKIDQQAVKIPESYYRCNTNSQEESEVIPSLYPDSLEEVNLSEAVGICMEPTDPCQETISEMQISQKNLENEKKDLYLPEELMEVDYLKQFKMNLPLLKTKLSRLRTLLVSDPLLSFKPTQDTSQVEIYERQTTERSMEGFADAEPTERIKTSADMEVDLTLSPVRKACINTLSTSALVEEPLSPQGQICFGSAKCQRELEKALWTAEKLPTFVQGFMLTEPQTHERLVDFQPLSEALRMLKSEERFSRDESTPAETGVLQTPLCSSTDFTESIKSDVPPSKTDVEEFKKMSAEQDFSIPSIPTPRCWLSILKRPEESALDPVLDHKKTHTNEAAAYRQQQTQNVSFGQTKTSNPSCPEFNLASKQNNICHGTKEKSPSKTTRKTLPLRQDRPERVLEDPLCKDLDPLSTFIKLRSQQTPPDTASSDVTKHIFRSEPQTTDQGQRIERLYLNAAVPNASREQSKAVSKCVPPFFCTSSKELQIQDRVVIQVQATECQYHAYFEVLSFVQPYMDFAQKLGLDMKVWGDFRCLTVDRTHFLVKQQEKALSNSHNVDLIRDQEQYLNQVTLIHVLVTFKELLLKCGLRTGVEFLKKRNMGDEKSFKKLLKRLQIILYLSLKKHETNPKLLELQRHLKTWFNNSKDKSVTDKILVVTNNSDNTRSIILGCLHQLIGSAAVTDLHLDKNKMKLNGASVVSSVCNSACALVCEQHIGPDFPWQCFSRLVEFDHPGPSPWASVCSERGLIHVSFSTAFPDNVMSPGHLEDNVPHVLFVTERLHSCPMLLQTLESTFNITVLERNHSMTLQMLGGTQQYAVITVDESTAIIIQRQEELCQERASERLVMRLSALSLQFSCCWLILHCPDSQGGGLSSEAFSNLILVYSSLVIFGLKSEDLNVKVLIVSNVLDMAKWISQICFHSLMSSDKDPAAYLDREWLIISESNEEKCLLHFPCINPMVSQLMLRRAPNLQWLLGAPLPELKEMLPEVPHKVLKLFNDTTSLYTQSDFKKCESPALTIESVKLNNYNSSNWMALDSPVQDRRFPFGVQGGFCDTASTKEPAPDVRFRQSASFMAPDVCKQKSWTISDLWKDGRDKGNASDWRGGSGGAMGKMVGRADLRMSQHNSFVTTHQVVFNSPFKAESMFSYNRELQQSRHLTPSGGEVAEQGPGFSPNFTFHSGAGLMRATAAYGSKTFMGQERKRSGDAETLLGTVLTQLKRSKLSYEKVPGRSDGQTRLKLF